jgi:uncharacterized cupin superfamily protein
MKIVRSEQVPWSQEVDHGRFQGLRKTLGGTRISCGLWQLPPGKRSFPLHRHLGTEEAMFVVSGRAKVRTTEGETPIGPGDFVSFPPAEVAHQLVNDEKEPLVYLAISHSLGVDIVEYPDTGKISSSAGVAPNRQRFIFDGKTQVEYWSGEE